MENSLYFSHVIENEYNQNFLYNLEQYCVHHSFEQVYVLNAPLGKKYTYDYQDRAIVILSPKHKIMFVNLDTKEKEFERYYEDFIEDLGTISDTFEYKEAIGRPREWKSSNTVNFCSDKYNSIDEMFEDNKIFGKEQRINEFLISLLIGSINDIEKKGVEVPDTVLDKIKKNIILFDGNQTRFIFQEFNSKTVSIQGLSGTGKTELLLHKLKELYINNEDVKIFFTCHNIALANYLKEKTKDFFNFMKVNKQIDWDSSLWIAHAWGSGNRHNSGLYSYLCNFYNAPFHKYNKFIEDNYHFMFSNLLKHINNIDENDFDYALDYILIDERQDFPSVFFDLCAKVARHKVYIAGDIFQDIFDKNKNEEVSVDIILNRCYRTDPRTLMFAHALGLGLFEQKKLNWFSDEYWNNLGYNIKRNSNNEVILSREPVRRFNDPDLDAIESVVIENDTTIGKIIEIIKNLKTVHNDLKADDLAIILVDENRNEIFSYMDKLTMRIGEEIGWACNRAIESKMKISDQIFVTNPNNVKGLEFPFVICVTSEIKDTYKYRNTIYTMLSRSFIQSYLLVGSNKNLLPNLEGLKIINNTRTIVCMEPTQSEKEEILTDLLTFNIESTKSYEDFLDEIFNELKINEKEEREQLIKGIQAFNIPQFDKEKTVQFIRINRDFTQNG